MQTLSIWATEFKILVAESLPNTPLNKIFRWLRQHQHRKLQPTCIKMKACIWDHFHKKGPSAYYLKCYNKNESRLNRYNIRTVDTINFLLSTILTTSFLYLNLYIGDLYKHSANVTRSVTSWGSKLISEEKRVHWKKQPLARYSQLWLQLLVMDQIAFWRYAPRPTEED